MREAGNLLVAANHDRKAPLRNARGGRGNGEPHRGRTPDCNFIVVGSVDHSLVWSNYASVYSVHIVDEASYPHSHNTAYVQK
jgi:hypothetical protein